MQKVTTEDLPAEALKKTREKSAKEDVIVIFGSLSFLQSLKEWEEQDHGEKRENS